MKILYVSDSLGKPNYPRGIFQYSAGLIQTLAELGHHIDLVVEKPSDINNNLPSDETYIRDQLISSHIYHSLTYNNKFVNKTENSTIIDKAKVFNTLTKTTISLLKILIKIPLSYFFTIKVWAKVGNNFREMTCLYSEYNFYKNFKNFIVINNFYLSEIFLSLFTLPPIKLNAKGYDLILVDNPLYINLEKDNHTNVVTVVYDLIPMHDTSIPSRLKNITYNRLKCAIKYSSKLIFISQATHNEFSKYFNKKFPSTVIYPIFLPKNLQPSANIFIDKKIINLVTIAANETRKNVQGCINTLEFLPENFCLHIIGKALPNLLVPENLKNRVHFTGFVSEKDKLSILINADILLFMSISEGFGIPLVEGIYYTGKVVCSDIPVFREVITNFAGFCDPQNPEKIAKTIIDELPKPKITQSQREEIINRFTLTAQKETLSKFINDLKS